MSLAEPARTEPARTEPARTEPARARARMPALRVGLLLAGFAAAVVTRVGVGGVGVAQSVPAGLVFAGALAVLTVADQSAGRSRHPAPARRGVTVVGSGLVGAALICAPALASHAWNGTLRSYPWQGFAGWVLAIGVVATAEERFLRGTLFDALEELSGPATAIGVCAVAFALLHVPLYGWHVLPLDTAVGVVLGGLRFWTGTWVAPGVAHVAADIGGWFLR